MNTYIKTELNIFKQIWYQLIPTIILLLYFGIIVFRSLAFYRYEQRPVLKDLGFQIIPKIPQLLGFSNLLLSLQHSLIFLLSFILLIKNYSYFSIQYTGPYIINIWRRYFNIITIGNILRFLTYISTSLPGPAEHCQPGSTDYHPPTKWYQIFYTFNSANCGDLIFSGHLFHLIIAMFIFNKYASDIISNNYLLITLKILSWIAIPLEIFLILATRQHYSVDLIVAIYTSIFLWIVYDNKIQPLDYKPIEINKDNRSDIMELVINTGE